MVRITTAGGESVQATRLNQQLRGTLDLMTKDLQRAGYVNWSGAGAWVWDEDGPVTNPYTDDDDGGTPVYNILDFYEAAVPRINEFGQVRLFSFATPGDASTAASACTTDCECILYSYDIDGNGALSTGDFELFGFRLNDGAVEMRTAGNDHTCSTGTWQDVTDDNLEITSLGFTLLYVNDPATGDATVYPIQSGASLGPNVACVPGAGALLDDKCLWRRKVAISISAQLAADNAVQLALNTDVKVKNDYFQSAP